MYFSILGNNEGNLLKHVIDENFFVEAPIRVLEFDPFSGRFNEHKPPIASLKEKHPEYKCLASGPEFPQCERKLFGDVPYVRSKNLFSEIEKHLLIKPDLIYFRNANLNSGFGGYFSNRKFFDILMNNLSSPGYILVDIDRGIGRSFEDNLFFSRFYFNGINFSGLFFSDATDKNH